MSSQPCKNFLYRINLVLVFVFGLFALRLTTWELSEVQSAIFAGFSMARLVIILVIILTLFCLAGLFAISLRADFWSGRIGNFIFRVFYWRGLPVLLLALLSVFYFLVFSSAKILGDYSSYRDRLLPLLAWFFILIIQVFIVLFGVRVFENSHLKWLRVRLQGVWVAFGILGLLVLFIGWSRVGLTPDKVYWMEPGVPLLFYQVLLAVGLGMLFLVLQKRGEPGQGEWLTILKKLIHNRLFLCLLIWAIASAVWLSTPLRPSYNSIQPRAPNFQNYPFGDAMYYDIHAQSVLIGKSIPSHFWVKPLYTLFLSGLHMLAAQDYTMIVSLQVLVLALIPALGYLIMDAMGSRAVGLTLAFLLIFREQNAIALSNVIQVSNSKLLMSDVFSMGLMALLTWLLVLWSRDPAVNRGLPLAAGGTLGLLVLTRGHPILLVPVLGLLMMLVLSIQRKVRLWLEVLLLLAFGLALPLSPWLVRNYQQMGKVSFQDAPKAYSGQLANLYAPDPSTDYGAQLSSDLNLDQEEETQNQIIQYILQRPGDVIQFVSAHYFHNLIFSYIYLPQSFQIEELRSYVKGMPFWGVWEGFLPASSRILLVLNLGVLTLGFNALWRKNRAFVLVPVFLILGYNLSVSVSRLSGWRLVIPFDWLVLIFYSMGLVQLVQIFWSMLGGRQATTTGEFDRQTKTTNKWWKTASLGAVFFGLGVAVTMVNVPFQNRYYEKTSRQLLKEYAELPVQFQAGLVPQELEKFVEQDGAIAISGRALFPVFFPAGVGGQSVFAPAFDEQTFSRLAFHVIGSQSIGGSLQLDSAPADFPGFVDVIMFGCHAQGRYGDYVDVLTVILKTEPATVYVRSSTPDALVCPFSSP